MKKAGLTRLLDVLLQNDVITVHEKEDISVKSPVYEQASELIDILRKGEDSGYQELYKALEDPAINLKQIAIALKNGQEVAIAGSTESDPPPTGKIQQL